MAKTNKKKQLSSAFIAGQYTPRVASGDTVLVTHYDYTVGPGLQKKPGKGLVERLQPMTDDIGDGRSD